MFSSRTAFSYKDQQNQPKHVFPTRKANSADWLLNDPEREHRRRVGQIFLSSIPPKCSRGKKSSRFFFLLAICICFRFLEMHTYTDGKMVESFISQEIFLLRLNSETVNGPPYGILFGHHGLFSCPPSFLYHQEKNVFPFSLREWVPRIRLNVWTLLLNLFL